MPCTSTLRRAITPTGWFCTGENLVVLTFLTVDAGKGRQSYPIVCPRSRLSEALEQPWPDLNVYDYAETGDHLHAVLVDTGLRAKLDALLAKYDETVHGPDAADFVTMTRRMLAGEFDPRLDPLPVD